MFFKGFACIFNECVVVFNIFRNTVLQEISYSNRKQKCSINSSTTNVPPSYMETSQLICIANQLTSFYMLGNIGR